MPEYDKAEKSPRMIVNVIVTQHHRRPSTQISHKPFVLGYIVDGLGGFGWFCWWLWVVLAGFVAGFGWFWLVPCFSNCAGKVHETKSTYHTPRFRHLGEACRVSLVHRSLELNAE